MKPKILFLIVIVAVVAGVSGWYAARHASHGPGAAPASGERKIRFYQCSMHPQVKSDKPGKCTICGMDLSPIYEGQSELSENLVTLSPSTIQVVNVQTALVQRRAMQRTIRVAGMIDDDDSKHRILSAYIDGRIEELFVNFTGAEVSKGEPLATFYSPSLLTAEREYLVLLQRKSTNANPVIEAEQKRLVDAAAQRLQRLGLTPQQIQELGVATNSVARSKIVAPMTGSVVSRSAYEGQYVKEGDPLFEIADFSTMWFQFDAYEQDLSWLKPGQKVQVTTPAAPGKEFEGVITFINPNVNDPTRSAKVRVELANPLVDVDGTKRRLLLHKLYGEGSIEVDLGERLTIPRTAVLNPGGDPIVYVAVDEASYEQRKVKLGVRGNEMWEVLDGLNDGESVVTYGNTLIDAQAQLNQSSQSPGEQHGHEELPAKSLAPLEKLNATQQQEAEALIGVANRLGVVLAADDLKSFNQEVAKASPAVTGFENAFAKLKGWRPLTEPIARHKNLSSGKDLAEARKNFHPFSMAVAEFTKHLRTHEESFKEVKIYRCPMVNQAVPGAPKNGFWIQLQSPLRNPYFGADMLECGTEVTRD